MKKERHYIKVTIEFIAEVEDVNLNELLEEMRGTGNATVVNVEAFNSPLELYELANDSR
jgi:hypothetical protein